MTNTTSIAPGQHWEKTGNLSIHTDDNGHLSLSIGDYWSDLAEDVHTWLSRDDSDSYTVKGIENAKRITARVTVEILDVEFYNG